MAKRKVKTFPYRQTNLASMKGYRGDIDGLRALAVLSVVAFHFGVAAISGGFAGVDIFFVISGYLISSIILKDLHAGTFSFADFYARRIRRIFPALMRPAVCSAGWMVFR